MSCLTRLSICLDWIDSENLFGMTNCQKQHTFCNTNPRICLLQVGNSISELGNSFSDFGGTISKLGKTISDFGKTISELGNSSSDFGKRISKFGRTISNFGNQISLIWKTISKLDYEIIHIKSKIFRRKMTKSDIISRIFWHFFHDFLFAATTRKSITQGLQNKKSA